MEEIEAKFSIPDSETYRHLESIGRLNVFTILEGQIQEVKDTYLDTANRDLMNAGLACRVRQTGDKCIVTVKALAPADKAVHHREELEMILPEPLPLQQWPNNKLRRQVRAIVADAPLEPLFDLQQTRHRRPALQGDKIVAELSLDTVRQIHSGHTQDYIELEIELKPDGSEENLQTLSNCLQKAYDLIPQTISKFERGLAFIKSIAQPHQLLTPEEFFKLETIALRNDAYGRRARVLLALDAGISPDEAGQQGQLSERRARYWLAQFQTRRLSIFPEKSYPSVEQLPSGDETAPQATIAPEPEPKPPVHPGFQSGYHPHALPETPGLTPDDSMAEAARKTLRFHFWQMLSHEAATLLGGNHEDLHKMRVAARRMRAALRIFAGHLDVATIKPHIKNLRQITKALGTVRDLDVFHEHTKSYLAALPPKQRPDLTPLIQAWQRAYEKARADLDSYLRNERYNDFKETFGDFLETPFTEPHPLLFNEIVVPCRVRHIAPVIIYQRLAEVRAYDEWVIGPDVPLARYHRLRIAAKDLRYTLEFFCEILGAEVSVAINELKGFQDHLGSLQDAVVASGRLRNFWIWGDWDAPGDNAPITAGVPVIAPGVAIYHAAQHVEIQQLLASFGPVWQQFLSSDFNQLIARAVNEL
ncbi:MAG: CHAD domain-containing protein [Anaerolineae bacterium]|nr:CHAD domain-containing protein [Anaerolineae bacterium]